MFESLKNLLTQIQKKKDSSNTILVTNITKKIYLKLSREGFLFLLQKENNSLSSAIKSKVNGEPTIIPIPTNEQDIAIFIIYGLFLYKQRNFKEAQAVLQ